MAAPIIDSITITPSTIAAGGRADIRITAHDPDAGSVHISLVLTDSTGAKTTGSGTIAVSDPLTYAVTVDRGHVTQDAADPAVFHFVDA